MGGEALLSHRANDGQQVMGTRVVVTRRARLVGVALAVFTIVGLLGSPVGKSDWVAAAGSSNTPAGLGGRIGAEVPDQLIVYTSFDHYLKTVPGHVFVDIKDTHDAQCKPIACHHIWGKYPGGTNIFDTDGKIKTDNGTAWTWRISYNLTQSQYNAAFDFLVSQQKNPSRYQIKGANCVDWAAQIASKAGHPLSFDYKDFANISDPRVFRDTLEKAGIGSTLAGGLVLTNPKPNSNANGAPDPPPPAPPCCDVGNILQVTMTDPRSLASDLGLRFSQRQLSPDHLNGDGSYDLVIDNTDPAHNLYGVVWGDGKSTVAERPMKVAKSEVVLSHTYQTQPANPLQVFILENGQLNELDRNIQGPQGGSGESEYVVEPPPGPKHRYA
jgi:hypothetical protein